MCCVGMFRSILVLTVQQDPNTCQNMTNRLAACWAVCNLDSSPLLKRNRPPADPFTPPIAPGVGMPPARTAFRFDDI
jgi:hypothetical protein